MYRSNVWKNTYATTNSPSKPLKFAIHKIFSKRPYFSGFERFKRARVNITQQAHVFALDSQPNAVFHGCYSTLKIADAIMCIQTLTPREALV